MIHYSGKAIPLASDLPPQLIVVIDTEEEFDWNKPVDRNATSVESMQYINRVQDIFDEYGIKPCYVVDYPIATQEMAYGPLGEIFRSGRCEIGSHLHPWVNPPYTEILESRNTYPGNLDRALEFEKLNNLTQQIRSRFDFDPVIYKAGRYGFGKNTRSILNELGYRIDLSFSPSFDHGYDGGPDFSEAHAQPFWFDDQRTLLEIPLTSSFIGVAGGASKLLFNFAQATEKLKMPGILSRCGLVDRIILSPEGYTPQEHVKISNYLYRRGVRTFTWSFHSSTILPGATDYVQNEQELKQFLGSFRQYFDFFFNTMKGVATTPTSLKALLES